MTSSTRWSQIINPNILRFEYDPTQHEKIDEVIEEFRGDKKVAWHKEDGPIEVCVYYPLFINYKEKGPVLVQVYEWGRGIDGEGYNVPIPRRYDFFLGLVERKAGYLFGANDEDVKNLIEKHKLRYRRVLFKKPLERVLKRNLEDLEKMAK